MSSRQALTEELSAPGIGHEIHDLASEIYPICRSITGQGVRETLDCLSQHINITTHKVPTGTKVFDWEIPKEWTIRDAFIRNESGERVVDFRSSNLHVLNYSIPVNVRLPLSDLKRHVFTLPEQPDLIPYRTSYYTESWGFCMSHRQLSSFPDGIYEAVIDTSLEPGHLYYGEFLHPGTLKDEFLLSAHICHPSLANDNCSGLALLTHLAKRLSNLRTRYSYRFLFAPGTIGSISWLARNEDKVSRIKHGLVVSCVGDGGGPTYKRSRRGDAMIDRAMYHALKCNWPAGKVIDFFPYGYDERQFCSPGFNLPVGLLQRSQFGTFPEYHTSADNLDFIKPEHLAASYNLITDVISTIEGNRRPVNLLPKCEPQLGRRGLFSSLGGDPDGPAKSMALLWVLNLADGDHTLLDIAERSGMAFQTVADAASLLVDNDLLSYRRDE
jgi:aminopeptidase-like protein